MSGAIGGRGRRGSFPERKDLDLARRTGWGGVRVLYSGNAGGRKSERGGSWLSGSLGRARTWAAGRSLAFVTRWSGTFPWGRGRHECRCLTHSGATHTTSLVADARTAGPASGRGVAEGGRGRGAWLKGGAGPGRGSWSPAAGGAGSQCAWSVVSAWSVSCGPGHRAPVSPLPSPQRMQADRETWDA